VALRRCPRRAALALTVLAVGFSAHAAAAATLTVTTTSDTLTPGDGQCTLREAIVAVNAPGSASDCGKADASSNTIVLPASGAPYLLSTPANLTDDQTTGDLDVNPTAPPLTIAGAGPAATDISAALAADRVMHVLPGAIVTLKDLTVSDGHGPAGAPGSPPVGVAPAGAGGAGFNGGGLFNGGTMSLTDVAVVNNDAGDGGKGGDDTNAIGGTGGAGGPAGAGGGIFNTGTLTLTGVTITGNRAGTGGAGGHGGAGANFVGTGFGGGPGGLGGAGGIGGAGGAVANVGGTVSISGATLSANTAGSGGAGAIGGNGGPGDLGTGSGGVGGAGGAAGSGGALSTSAGSLSLVNATLTANTGGNGGSGGQPGTGSLSFFPKGGAGGNGAFGGGVFVTGAAPALLTNDTIASNQLGAAGFPGGGSQTTLGAPGSNPAGGGINTATAPAAQLRNTLLSSNQFGNCAGTAPTDLGHNLSFGPSGCTLTFATGDPKLGALADNGGPVKTMALGSGSAAIDQVPATGAGCPATDERGVTRPAGAACDIGAYEVSTPVIVLGAATDITPVGATLNATVTADQAAASVRFEFGTTTAYGTQTAPQAVSGVAAVPVTAPATGLVANTTYHYRLVATSADGTTASADATFTTLPIGSILPFQNPTPKLTKLTVRVTKPKPARHRSHAKPKTPTITITYTDSTTATTKLVVSRVTTGVRKGHSCVKRTRKTNGKSCTRLTKIATATHHDVAGTNTVHITGHTLAKGRYSVAATPTAGTLKGATATKTFTVH
jgi:CSLREA domain-containing protein